MGRFFYWLLKRIRQTFSVQVLVKCTRLCAVLAGFILLGSQPVMESESYSSLIVEKPQTLVFKNLKMIHPETLKNLQDWTRSMTTTLQEPPQIEVQEVVKTPYNRGEITYDQKIILPHERMTYPNFVHEYGHALIYHNLNLRVPEFRKQQYTSKKFTELNAEITELSKGPSDPDYHQELEDEFNLVQNEFRKQPDYRVFTGYFEEVFSDLLVAGVYGRPDVMDPRKLGFRNFEADTTGRIPAAPWDNHVLLQPLGKYIYKKYMKSTQYRKAQIFDAFYRLIEAELVENIKSGRMKQPAYAIKTDKIIFYGKDSESYIKELQVKFDGIIAGKGK
jgi:hypothetical protein